ncbi:MAG: nitrate- and nitrite sensing domain-containing protein [Gammaproteobacteria bacterium]|nr:nitrate- and nitrite sensing domain-containing protein [Gammaproteobacteria bacterium]
MSLSLLFPACALLSAGYLLPAYRSTQTRAAGQRLLGLQAVKQLRQLLEALPQHRGMANALLQGDESFRPKLTSLQASIDQDMARTQALLSVEAHWGVGPRSQTLLDAWSTIKQQLSRFSAAESFGRHTALMTELLYLINDVADAAGLLLAADPNARLMDTAINTLPLVTETLGQARGMGTGVAARGRCSIEMRVKLRYLLANTRRVAEQMGQDVRGALAQRDAVQEADFGTRAGHALDQSQRTIQAFLSLLENDIIHERSVELAPSDFYTAGTEAIQHSFSLLDTLLGSLQHRLALVEQAQQRQLWLSRGLALALLLPAGYLLVASLA